MKKILLIVSASLLIIIASSFIVYGVVFNVVDRTQPFTGSLDEQVDTFRASYDLPGLNETPALDSIAQSKCNDMVDRQYFEHKDPEGQLVWEQYQFEHKAAGENLAWGYSNASDVTSAWVNSKDHKKNLLDTRFTQVGYGTCLDQNHYKIVQVLKG